MNTSQGQKHKQQRYSVGLSLNLKSIQYKRIRRRPSSIFFDDQHNQTVNHHVQLPTFGNWKKQQPLLTITNTANNYNTIDKIQNVNKKQIPISSRDSSQQKPRFPRNNKIIRQFIMREQIPKRYESFYKNENNSQNQNHINLNKAKDKKLCQTKNNNKSMFVSLYLKQKQQYQTILKKYGILEKVDQSQFNNFFENYNSFN